MTRDAIKNILIAVLSVTTLAPATVVALNWKRLALFESHPPDRDRTRQMSAFGGRPSVSPPGDPSALVRGAIRAKASELQVCYETYLGTDPSRVDGSIKVGWRIEPGGGVGGVSILETEFNDPSLANCLVKRIEKWSFQTQSKTGAPPIFTSHRFTFRKRAPASLAFE